MIFSKLFKKEEKTTKHEPSNRFGHMRFNNDLYYQIWKIRKGDPTYSFVFGSELPDDKNNGKNYISPHYLEGKKITRNGEDFWIKSVQVHFYQGYHYHIIANNINDSSVMIWVPINNGHLYEDNHSKYLLEDGTKLKDHLKYTT